jgi:hypothetical protein
MTITPFISNYVVLSPSFMVMIVCLLVGCSASEKAPPITRNTNIDLLGRT